MPLSEKEVKSLRDKAANIAEKNEKIKEIALHDPKKSIPVILKILQEALEKMPAERRSTEADLKTRRFLEWAEKLLKDADKILHSNIFSQLSSLGKLKKNMEPDLKEMSARCKQAIMPEKLKSEWQEAAIWLEGLYHHTYDLVEKDVNGKPLPNKNYNDQVGPVDKEDTIFYGIVGMTKYSVALFYHETAEALESHIQQYDADLQEKEADKAADKVADSQLASSSEEQVPVLDKKKDLISIQTQRYQGSTRLIVDIPDADKEKIAKIQAAIEFILNASPPYQNEKIFTEPQLLLAKVKEDNLINLLTLYQQESDELRFAVLVAGIEHCHLDQNTESLIKSYSETIKATINSYNNAMLGTHWIPTLFMPRKHASMAKKAVKEIKSSQDDVGNLFTLYELWLNAKQKNSSELFEKTTGLLKDIYTILLKGASPLSQSSPRI